MSADNTTTSSSCAYSLSDTNSNMYVAPITCPSSGYSYNPNCNACTTSSDVTQCSHSNKNEWGLATCPGYTNCTSFSTKQYPSITTSPPYQCAVKLDTSTK